MEQKRKFTVNFKRVILYSVVVEGEYPQDVEKRVLEEANDPQVGIYDLGSYSTTEISDMVTEAQVVSEFYGDQWFDPDFTRKEPIEPPDLAKYGFDVGYYESPIPDCGCVKCKAYYKDHPFERRNKPE